MKFKTFNPLVCFKSTISNCYYIIADGKWHEVDRQYSLEELVLMHEKITPKETAVNSSRKSYEVSGSGGKIYEVTFMNSMWSCTCPAHSFRKYTDCKHITQIKSTLK